VFARRSCTYCDRNRTPNNIRRRWALTNNYRRVSPSTEVGTTPVSITLLRFFWTCKERRGFLIFQNIFFFFDNPVQQILAELLSFVRSWKCHSGSWTSTMWLPLMRPAGKILFQYTCVKWKWEVSAWLYPLEMSNWEQNIHMTSNGTIRWWLVSIYSIRLSFWWPVYLVKAAAGILMCSPYRTINQVFQYGIELSTEASLFQTSVNLHSPGTDPRISRLPRRILPV